MKLNITIILVAIIAISIGCEPQINTPTDPDEPQTNFCPGMTAVTGTVSNEQGVALEGIMIEVFYDESLTEQLPYGSKWPVFTNKEGKYSIGTGGCKSDRTYMYAVATDTTGIYESQVKRGVLDFWYSPIWENGKQDISAHTIINFVLKKKN